MTQRYKMTKCCWKNDTGSPCFDAGLPYKIENNKPTAIKETINLPKLTGLGGGGHSAFPALGNRRLTLIKWKQGFLFRIITHP